MTELLEAFVLMLLVGLIWWPTEMGATAAKIVKGYKAELTKKDDDD